MYRHAVSHGIFKVTHSPAGTEVTRSPAGDEVTRSPAGTEVTCNTAGTVRANPFMSLRDPVKKRLTEGVPIHFRTTALPFCIFRGEISDLACMRVCVCIYIYIYTYIYIYMHACIHKL